jgi:uncharacterized membrane protein YhaH (DUF805 family)
MGLLSLYFSPAGRIGRARFWLGLLGLALVEPGFLYWFSLEFFGRDLFDNVNEQLAKPALQLLVLVSLIFLLPQFCLFGKRFHDRGRSAFWAIPYFIGQIGTELAGATGYVDFKSPTLGIDPNSQTATSVLAALVVIVMITLWTYVELGLLRGTKGVNRFGPDPLAAAA